MHRVRVLSVWLLTAAVLGCGNSTPLPDSLRGSFMIIEASVTDLTRDILAPTYRPDPTLGTDSDRIGLALGNLKKNAEGSRLAPDVEDIQKKFDALSKLASTRAPLPKQREAAKELQAAVEATKAKM